MKFLFAVLLVPLLIIPAFAEEQTLSTDKGTLDVKLSYDDIVPGDLNSIRVDFLNGKTKNTQVHIDYKIKVSKDNEIIFQTPNLMHTSEGFLKGLKIEFPEDGVYSMDFEIEGILFNPIPTETVSFDITVGEAHAQPPISDNDVPPTEENGGCLIATAAYGSEMAPQVQQLREIRDNTVLSTESGTAFMSGFNQFYYSFSPGVADLERENPVFKEMVKVGLTPMLSSLSLLNYVDIDSEQEMLGYGVSIILLNIGMYVGIPVFGILKLYQFRKN
ncbi:CFI-box-CTERM domain-containing protein [Candidatus Nitrosopumilus sediminis]|uniref:Copper-binding protein n=1 Tax=Candidatus Nitrosopumilus sediminis TaxID=1229909 RepID=K0BH24_9ARCH|nr:CFI-box-CTERM domain-containing protein [Candidatus Nitrosopumilus sediminis]AFS83576.1 hypothetical protein NSED_08930 [Candidatus Nitrosopumilus sediminis]